MDNIDSISFSIHHITDDKYARSDFADFKLKESRKSFSYGDAFGCDGQSYWMDLNQTLEDFDEVSDEDQEMWNTLRTFIEDNGFDF